jgi:hypothetical protein
MERELDMYTRNNNPNNETPNDYEVELPVPERKNDTITSAESNVKWHENKLNESFNENTSAGISVDEKGGAKEGTEHIDLSKEAGVSGKGKQKGMLGDTRRDSIIDRPRTETYEKDTDDKTNVLYIERDEEEEKW